MIEIDQNNKEKYKKFAIKKLEEYIDYIISTNEYQTYNIPKEIIEFDDSLNEYFAKKGINSISSKIKTIDDVIDLIKSLDREVNENNLPSGSQPNNAALTTTGSITLAVPDGLASISIGIYTS